MKVLLIDRAAQVLNNKELQVVLKTVMQNSIYKAIC